MGAFSSKPNDAIGESLRADPDLYPDSFPKTTGLVIELPPDAPGAKPRKLGYAEYGETSPSARHTLVFMHGTPGTRFFFSATHAAHAAQHSVRVLVPERPGYGLSDPIAAPRTLVSTSRDVLALLDALGVARAHILGYSAGGPFALAFASAHPSRVLSASVVCSLGPNEAGVTSGMSPLSRFGYWLAAHAPPLLRALVRLLAPQAVGEAFDPYRDDFSPAENAAFATDAATRRVFAKATLELYSRAGGADAEAADYVLMARDWGFDLAQIGGSFPLRVYAGEKDFKCTVGMFRGIVRRLPAERTLAVLGEGENHLWFYRLFGERLLQDLGIARAS